MPSHWNPSFCLFVPVEILQRIVNLNIQRKSLLPTSFKGWKSSHEDFFRKEISSQSKISSSTENGFTPIFTPSLSSSRGVISLQTPTTTEWLRDFCGRSRAQRRRIVNENLPAIERCQREKERKKKKHQEGAKSLNRAIRLSIAVLR